MKKQSLFVCTGVTAADGCGAVLTMVERRLHDGRCELCALDWDERVRGWRLGQADADLEAHFEDGGGRPAKSAPAIRKAEAA